MTFDLELLCRSLFPGKYADIRSMFKIFNWIHGHYRRLYLGFGLVKQECLSVI